MTKGTYLPYGLDKTKGDDKVDQTEKVAASAAASVTATTKFYNYKALQGDKSGEYRFQLEADGDTDNDKSQSASVSVSVSPSNRPSKP